MHQVVDPEHVNTGYVRMHRVHAPAVVARCALAGVQRVIGELAAATIVHERSFATLVPGARHVPHGVENVSRADKAAALT